MQKFRVNICAPQIRVLILAGLTGLIFWICFYDKHAGEETFIMQADRMREPPLFNREKEMKRLNELKVDQDDPRLIRLIRDHYILKPSKEPYNLKNPNKKEFTGQGKDYLLTKTVGDLPEKGFFIECGAHNGEFLSSTLFFEREKHWSGVLIEANPYLFAQLRQKNRKAYAVNACLSTKPYPSVMQFNLHGGISRLVEGDLKKTYRHHHGFANMLKENITQVQCFPLYSILLALNQTKVDYMGLDVEGSELSILKTVPWPKVNITTMLVEHSHQDGGVKPMKTYLENNGYKTLKIVNEDILVHKRKSTT